jgi:hypothetical protein
MLTTPSHFHRARMGSQGPPSEVITAAKRVYRYESALKWEAILLCGNFRSGCRRGKRLVILLSSSKGAMLAVAVMESSES